MVDTCSDVNTNTDMTSQKLPLQNKGGALR